MKKKLIFIVGPTAIGKTNVACVLAGKINAEIVSCDSMQIYKGMEIITSKPSPLLIKKIPHHLIGILTATKEYNVSRYRKAALKKIKEIIKRGNVPVFVGGSGLYVSILIDGIFKARSANQDIRKRLYGQVLDTGSVCLYEKLKKLDPEAADKIHPNDTRRIVRALEVFETTGRPISWLQRQRKGLRDEYAIKIFGLNMERDKLYRRIECRVDRMFEQGLINEVRRLLKLKLSKTAYCAIGIKELKGYFDGWYDLEEAKRLIKRNTRAYAKRQLTWFRKDKRIKWINVKDRETPEKVAQRILKGL